MLLSTQDKTWKVIKSLVTEVMEEENDSESLGKSHPSLILRTYTRWT